MAATYYYSLSKYALVARAAAVSESDRDIDREAYIHSLHARAGHRAFVRC